MLEHLGLAETAVIRKRTCLSKIKLTGEISFRGVKIKNKFTIAATSSKKMLGCKILCTCFNVKFSTLYLERKKVKISKLLGTVMPPTRVFDKHLMCY